MTSKKGAPPREHLFYNLLFDENLSDIISNSALNHTDAYVSIPRMENVHSMAGAAHKKRMNAGNTSRYRNIFAGARVADSGTV